jgi:diacylglycerol kinase family enzyme
VYYYVYDSFLDRKEFQRIIPRIETETNNLGLTGERGQVTTLRKTGDLVRDAADRGYKPIVVVGNDETLNAAVDALASLKNKTALAYIPVEANLPLALFLGVTPDNAVVALSRRVVREVPLARANNHFFMARAECRIAPEQGTRSRRLPWIKIQAATLFEPKVLIDNQLTITAPLDLLRVEHKPDRAMLRIALIRDERSWFKRDPKLVEQSVFWGSRVRIESKKPLLCSLDGRQLARAPIDITTTNQTATLVVGRSRHFA